MSHGPEKWYGNLHWEPYHLKKWYGFGRVCRIGSGAIDCRQMTSYPFLKMAAATAKYYFRFHICWCHCLQYIKVYQQTKFRSDISIGGWDITTSRFEIQRSAILEFYFRFRARPFFRNRRVIPHPAAEFGPNRRTHCGNMTSYPFVKMAAATAKYYFRFRIC